jgi:tetratricopeptide (TPR) repeat protein
LVVRPGSIRKARAEAGLSLAQVASGEVSRTAVFLAETGKTRPTLPTIQLIASRTGKPIEYFLEPDGFGGGVPRPDLERLRELAAAENFDELLSKAEAAKLEAVEPVDRAWASFYAAQARIRRRAQARPALAELEDARAVFEAAGDRWMVVECMDWQAAALYLIDDRTAVEVAESALDACRRLKPANRALEARILGRLGSIHNGRRQWAKAVECYTEAVEVAGQLRDLSRVGKMYTDLGIAYEHLGDFTRSRAFSQKAITIHELLNDRLSVARAENNLGLVLMRQGDLQQAREHLNRSLTICDETGVDAVKSHVLLSLAELEINGHDPHGARKHLETARDLAEKSNEITSLGTAFELLGKLSDSANDSLAADHHFEAAIETFQRAGLSERLIGSHAAYARALEARGDIEAALDQLKRAVAVTRPDLASPAAASGEVAETA